MIYPSRDNRFHKYGGASVNYQYSLSSMEKPNPLSNVLGLDIPAPSA